MGMDGQDAFDRGDYKTAVEKWKPLAEQGNDYAQFLLGSMYGNGQGVAQDDKEAVKWYRLSAEQGFAMAQYSLGVMYDDKEAVKWFRLSAEQGNAMAQSNLGLMYANGQGVAQDDKEAVKWFRLSAEQGFARAQDNLGEMYGNGQGVAQDYVQAHKWFNLAGANGYEDGRKNRDNIEKRMTPAQIAQAQEMTRQWFAERQGGKQKSGTQLAQTPQPPKEQTPKKEADRLARERLLLEDERKKWEASRLAEENRQQQAQAGKEPAPQSGTGSGFFVSKLGHVITNAHVVKGCNRITVGDDANKQVLAEIINTDGRNDLALLKLSNLDMASAESKSLIQKLSIVVVPLASKGLLRSDDVRLGEKVLVAGYPYGDFFSNSIKVTTGVVSSTRGAGDDTGQFQLDAAVQPGNSGGPIYDSSGNIVGVVVAQLDKLKMSKAIGSMPENVNFGIKASTVRQFLVASGLPSKNSERTEDKSTEQLAEIASNQALMVMCLQ
jgi:uncharacterized protein